MVNTKSFSPKNDHIHLGDLSWIGQHKPEGYEYITTPMRSGEWCEYIYEMIMISEGLPVNELVCRFKGPMDQNYSFMMEMQSQWVEGPLEIGLSQ